MMITWRKSSRSGDGDRACVELSTNTTDRRIRDSTAPETGYLSLSIETFADLVVRVKRDELNL